MSRLTTSSVARKWPGRAGVCWWNVCLWAAALPLPSNSTGGLKSVAMGIGACAHIRRQFKISIGKMEGIEEPLARIAGNAYVMDAAASLITYGIMLGEKTRRAVSDCEVSLYPPRTAVNY